MSHPDINTIYLEKTPDDLPGEAWKDIPGFEGSYQASSLGRVRSLDRFVPHPRLKRQYVKGRILRQSVSKNRNLLTGEPMTDLRVTLTIEGRPHYFNTRRVIYQTFTDPYLDYARDGLYVINTDGNGYDNRPENLKLVTKSEKQKRVFTRNRMEIKLKTADRSGWKKNLPSSKPVALYDLQGNLIAEFPSVHAASRETGIDYKAITGVARGIYRQWNGFVCRYIQTQNK